MQTSIEIAQKVTLKPIREIMEGLGLADEDVEFYGKYNGKVRLQTLQNFLPGLTAS